MSTLSTQVPYIVRLFHVNFIGFLAVSLMTIYTIKVAFTDGLLTFAAHLGDTLSS